MLEFFARYRNVSVLVAVLFLQFILLGYQVKRDDDVRILRVWTVGAITPIEIALNAVSSFVTSTWQDYVWLVGARAQSRQLREQVSRLKLENQEFRRELTRLGGKPSWLTFRSKFFRKAFWRRRLDEDRIRTQRRSFSTRGRGTV